MHRQYTDFEISNGKTIKPSNENIIEFVSNTLYSDEIIKKDMIKDSFKICGISKSLDGTEYEQFKWPVGICP